MSENPDGKITFREFSLAITPQLAGLPESAAKVEFNREQKDAHMRQMADSPGRTPKSIRGPFRDIQKSPAKSPYKQEFQDMTLKQTENPDTQYVLDMVKMGSPSKDKDALKHSHRVLKSVAENPVLHNHIKGQNVTYDQMWDDAMNGRNLAEQQHYHHQPEGDDLHREPVMPPQSSHVNPRASSSVNELLKLIAKNEVSLELLRQRLVRDCDDFNTVDAFRMMDKNATCKLSKKELADFLTQVV